MLVVLNSTLSYLYRVLGDFHMSIDIGAELLLAFRFLPLFHWH